FNFLAQCEHVGISCVTVPNIGIGRLRRSRNGDHVFRLREPITVPQRRALPPTQFAAYCAAGGARSSAPQVEVLQMSRMLALAGALTALALAAGPAAAQQSGGGAQQPPPPYGPPITLEQAKRVMAAAELEAAKNSWQVAIAILDSGGNMVMFH